MSSSNNKSLIEKFIAKYGEEKLNNYLKSHINEDNVLTIVGHSGFHAIPNEYIHGEVYIVTSGNINLTSKENTLKEYKKALSGLVKKLKEKNWKKIYFVPTGHTTLILQIKLIVYNILRISTIDLFYSKGNYFELYIDYRELLDKSK